MICSRRPSRPSPRVSPRRPMKRSCRGARAICSLFQTFPTLNGLMLKGCSWLFERGIGSSTSRARFAAGKGQASALSSFLCWLYRHEIRLYPGADVRWRSINRTGHARLTAPKRQYAHRADFKTLSSFDLEFQETVQQRGQICKSQIRLGKLCKSCRQRQLEVITPTM